MIPIIGETNQRWPIQFFYASSGIFPTAIELSMFKQYNSFLLFSASLLISFIFYHYVSCFAFNTIWMCRLLKVSSEFVFNKYSAYQVYLSQFKIVYVWRWLHKIYIHLFMYVYCNTCNVRVLKRWYKHTLWF